MHHNTSPLAIELNTLRTSVQFMVYHRVQNDDMVELSDKFWLGKLMEYPEIMTQGETLEELEANIIDAYQVMVLDDSPPEYQI